MTKRVAQTERLLIRQFKMADAGFVLRLLNEPSFLEFIGDRAVRTLADAEQYLRAGPIASYLQNGHGLSAVVLKSSDELIGMCGVLKRDTLPEPDLGYAFLPEFTGAGYAFEAAKACMRHAKQVLQIPALLAIVQADNSASIKLLVKLGFAKQVAEPPLLRFSVLL
jgi:[ribosomal protein S5]-alanine N-acetyltransferase